MNCMTNICIHFLLLWHPKILQNPSPSEVTELANRFDMLGIWTQLVQIIFLLPHFKWRAKRQKETVVSHFYPSKQVLMIFDVGWIINWNRNRCLGGVKLGEERPNSATRVRLWKIPSCHGKIEFRNKTQSSCTASATSLPEEDFKLDWGF